MHYKYQPTNYIVKVNWLFNENEKPNKAICYWLRISHLINDCLPSKGNYPITIKVQIIEQQIVSILPFL